jgi:hypothetical protein
MSGSDSQAIEAAARQLVAALEDYERDARALVATWLDMDLYATVSARVDELKLCCCALPNLSVPWVSLLISHAELVHCLWRSSQPSPPRRGEVQQRLEEHLACVRRLHAGAERIASRPPARPPLVS